MALQIYWGWVYRFDTRLNGPAIMPAEGFTLYEIAAMRGLRPDQVELFTCWIIRNRSPTFNTMSDWRGPYKTEDEARRAFKRFDLIAIGLFALSEWFGRRCDGGIENSPVWQLFTALWWFVVIVLLFGIAYQ